MIVLVYPNRPNHCVELTGENKLTIRDSGIAEMLVNLEKEWLGSKDFERHQAGFCCQWLLDNTCKFASTAGFNFSKL